MATDIYEKLAQHLDNLPAGYPRTESGVEIRILRRLFTPEDAELALHLTLIPEESRVEYVVDRVETTGTVWMGLTIGCGRCHGHKYDPLSQEDFFRLFAVFNNTQDANRIDALNFYSF